MARWGRQRVRCAARRRRDGPGEPAPRGEARCHQGAVS